MKYVVRNWNIWNSYKIQSRRYIDWELNCYITTNVMYFVFFLYLARKSEIIRSTELLLDAISSNDFESYAYVEF